MAPDIMVDMANADCVYIRWLDAVDVGHVWCIQLIVL